MGWGGGETDKLKGARTLNTYFSWKENVSCCLLSPLFHCHHIAGLRSLVNVSEQFGRPLS